jgi:hypothetical protein
VYALVVLIMLVFVSFLGCLLMKDDRMNAALFALLPGLGRVSPLCREILKSLYDRSVGVCASSKDGNGLGLRWFLRDRGLSLFTAVTSRAILSRRSSTVGDADKVRHFPTIPDPSNGR